MTTPVAIDIGANEVADGTQSIDDVRDKDAIIQRPETLKNIGPVMETMGIKHILWFFNFTYMMTNVPCFIYTYRNVLKMIRKRQSHDKTGLQIPNRKEMRLQQKNYQKYVFQHMYLVIFYLFILLLLLFLNNVPCFIYTYRNMF